MITNKYYVLALPEPAIDAILAHNEVVGQSVETQRRNNTEDKIVIKTKVGVTTKPGVIPGNPTQYDHAGILVVLQDAEWNPEI